MKSTVRVVADKRKIVSAVVTKKTFVSARAGGDAFRTRRKKKGEYSHKIRKQKIRAEFPGERVKLYTAGGAFHIRKKAKEDINTKMDRKRRKWISPRLNLHGEVGVHKIIPFSILFPREERAYFIFPTCARLYSFPF